MMFPKLHLYDAVSLDVETTGLQWWRDEVFGIAVAAGDNEWYWDIRKEPNVVDWLRDEFQGINRWVNHNVKFDWHFLHRMGIKAPNLVECTMIRAALIDEHRMTYDLDSVGRDYLGVGKVGDIYQELASLFGGKPTKAAQMPNLHRAPVRVVSKYAARDARVALDLWRHQEGVIEEQGLREVHTLETELLPVIVRMERRGVRIDVDAAEQGIKSLTKVVNRDQKILNDLAGFPVNPNPSGSIKRLFKPERVVKAGREVWQLVDGTIAQDTDAGAASLNADCLRSMTHPAAGMILGLRKKIKARDTFLKGHVLGHLDGDIIHANINQTKNEDLLGTGTGRLSINDPALQQIPKRDPEMCEIIRPVFIPGHGFEWVCCDWAQMDFRIFAHYVRDARILQMYQDDPNTDFHQLAAELTGLPRSARFSGDPNAKQINLGLVFGMGQGRLAQEMKLPFSYEAGSGGRMWARPGPEAEAVFDKYHSAIPGIGDLLGDAKSVAKGRGHVMTYFKRRIRFPGGRFTHKAGGLIFQGTAADALKQKLVEVDNYLESVYDKYGARLILNVHDEFDMEMPEEAADVRKEVRKILTAFGPDDRMSLRVPIRVDEGRGPNWYIASK